MMDERIAVRQGFQILNFICIVPLFFIFFGSLGIPDTNAKSHKMR